MRYFGQHNKEKCGVHHFPFVRTKWHNKPYYDRTGQQNMIGRCGRLRLNLLVALILQRGLLLTGGFLIENPSTDPSYGHHRKFEAR